MFRIVTHKKRAGKKANAIPKTFPKSLTSFYWLVIKKFPVYIGAMFIFTLLYDGVGLIVMPLTSQWMFYILENALTIDIKSVVLILSGIVGMYLIQNAITFVRSFLLGKYAQIVNRYKLFVLYNRLYNNDTDFFVKKSAGYVVSMGKEITGNFSALTWDFWATLIGNILGLLCVVGVLFSMNVWFVVIILGNGILRTIWQFYLQKKINVLLKEKTKLMSEISGVQTDSIDNIMTARYFGIEHLENKYIWNLRAPVIKLERQKHYLDRWRWLPFSLVWVALRALILWMCFVQIRDGQMTVASAAFVWASATSVTNVFVRMNRVIIGYFETRAKARLAWDELIAERSVTDIPLTKQMKIGNADIEFDNVMFGYGAKNVLKHFNMCIKNGQRVGVVGLSGAGKTTLVNLLLRLYDVNDGCIKIGGVDIRDVKQNSLRQNIALVPQETALFNRTLLENIRYARPGASRADVVQAAKKANIHDFIMKQSDGYDTLVGNRGIKLSGGQRQRIAIARALLKNAPILILDEATSALDSENEMMIQSALQKVMKNKTTLAIAHRLSTLRNMDIIIVMDKGKIVESGSHKQLLRKNGVYKKLWSMQTNGFVGSV